MPGVDEGKKTGIDLTLMIYGISSRVNGAGGGLDGWWTRAEGYRAVNAGSGRCKCFRRFPTDD